MIPPKVTGWQCDLGDGEFDRTKNGFDDETGPYVSGPQDGRESWSYSEAKKSWWAEWNNALEEHAREVYGI